MKMRKILVALLCILLLPAAHALAVEAVDAGRSVSLTISFRDGDTAVRGAHFSAYLLAQGDPSGKMEPAAPFKRYNVNIQATGESDLAALASTLEGYVLRDGIAAAAGGVTDEAGMLQLSAQSGRLEQGMYLVLGDRCAFAGKTYTVLPTILTLPGQDAKKENWIYDVVIQPKYESTPDSGEGEMISRKVLKVWDDDGCELLRPKQIEVQLLCDGRVHDTVNLNAKQNWRHTWQQLDADHHWTVVEKEMDNYRVSMQQEGITYVLTNTYTGPEPIPTPTPKPSKPSGESPKLPQTGQLWWPVPMLASCGLLLIVIGLARRRGN